MRDDNCIFCKIIEKQIPATVVSEGEDYLAIRDINPQAPSHVLIMPKDHKANITEVEDALALGKLMQNARTIAKSEKLEKGFRLVINTGPEAGQTVDHLHIHLVGGRTMDWPPG